VSRVGGDVVWRCIVRNLWCVQCGSEYRIGYA
jgi:hypothetical protein